MTDNNEVRGKVVLWRAPHGSGEKWMYFDHEPAHLPIREPLVSGADYAALQAEADALRDMNRRQARRVMEQESARIAAEARAERLADALRSIRDVAREPYGTLNAAWVASTADAALAAEGRE